MQIGDNYLNDGHLLPERPKIDGCDRVPQCRPPHTNSMSFNSEHQFRVTTIASDTLAVAVSFEVPDAARRMRLAASGTSKDTVMSTTYIADHHGGPAACVVVRDFNVVTLCLVIF